jgi:hypothetical protein
MIWQYSVLYMNNIHGFSVQPQEYFLADFPPNYVNLFFHLNNNKNIEHFFSITDECLVLGRYFPRDVLS